MKSQIILFLFAGFLFLTQVPEAFGCSCISREAPAKAFRKADAVFVGTVRSISRGGGNAFRDLKVAFDVDGPLKVKSKEVDVFTSSQGTACGFPFEDGERYLVFAYRSEDTKFMETSICTRTRPVPLEGVDDEVQVLKSLANGRLEPRIFGTVYELIRGIYPLRADYWEERRSMKGVRIIAANMRNRFEAESDADGSFRITNLPPGDYRVTFKVPPGYKVGGDAWDESTEEEREQHKNLNVSITSFDNPDALRVEVRVDGRISGTLLDKTGRPVGKDVSITLVSKSTAEKEVGDIDYVFAHTDSRGNFEFFGIPPGEYYLGINIETRPHKDFPYPRTYFPAATKPADASIISLTPGQRIGGLSLRLPEKVREIEVRGIVVDGAGNPVHGAVVERYGLYNAPWRPEDGYAMKYVKQPTFEGRVKTDMDGKFVLRLLEGNRYSLNAFLEEKGSSKNILEGEDVEVDVSKPIELVKIVLDRNVN